MNIIHLDVGTIVSNSRPAQARGKRAAGQGGGENSELVRALGEQQEQEEDDDDEAGRAQVFHAKR
jgi:hypothetical protein